MSPRNRPTSRKHNSEGNAYSAVEHQVPLRVSTEQISPAKQRFDSRDSREQFLEEFELVLAASEQFRAPRR
jgi:hypothetical protein